MVASMMVASIVAHQLARSSSNEFSDRFDT
jgi:hypothetical protein